MSEVGEKVSDFDDEAKWKIMKYNVESDEYDGGGKEVVAYVGYSDHSSSSSSDEEELCFSCEEWKRCGRIVHSVVKEFFKNENFLKMRFFLGSYVVEMKVIGEGVVTSRNWDVFLVRFGIFCRKIIKKG